MKSTGGKFVRIAPYLAQRNGRVYGVKKFQNKIIRAVAPVQGLAAVDSRGRATKALKDWVKRWVEGIENAPYFAKAGGSSIPGFGDIIQAYIEIADLEYRTNGTPVPSTVQHNVLALRRVMRDAGLGDKDKITALTRSVLDGALAKMLADGAQVVSAFSNLNNIRGLWAKWCLERYRARGWHIEVPEFPTKRGKLHINTYRRPPEELRVKTMAWYKALEESEPMMWVACSMMLQFGMRNYDVACLEWSDIVREGDRWVLGYQPHKTRNSSGRRVHAVMSDGFYERLRKAGGKGELVLEGAEGVFDRVNVQMRELGWKPPEYFKGAYELRKMCIDRIYRDYGAEAAVQVSGDDIKTVCRYYADPSRATMVAMDMC